MSSPFFYIAAPFFNPRQVALVQMIEEGMRECGIRFFTPRDQDANKQPGPVDVHRAPVIFQENYRAMLRADAVLAVADWLMPEGQELRAIKNGHNAYTFEKVSPPLNLPDTGTVWEMGAMYALGKKVYIYTERPPEQGLNLMLTQGARGIVRGPEGLLRFFRGGRINEEALEQWIGKNQ